MTCKCWESTVYRVITVDSSEQTREASMSDQTDPALLHFAPTGTLGAKTP